MKSQIRPMPGTSRKEQKKILIGIFRNIYKVFGRSQGGKVIADIMGCDIDIGKKGERPLTIVEYHKLIWMFVVRGLG